jgi:SAM-dependent methyltransferase
MLKSHYKDIFSNQDDHWWYRGMTAINLSLLDKYLIQKRKLKILDAGCGPGVMLKPLQKYGNVLGIDISSEALKYAKLRGKVEKGDITKLRFKKNTFDLILSMDVLYHMWVLDVSKALSEYDRVLKKGGLLILREPAYNWMRGNEDRGSLTARRFTKKELEKLIEKNSFKVEKETYANFILFPIVLLVRIINMINKNKESSDLWIPSTYINNLLVFIFKIEKQLLNFFSFPFGSSLIFVLRKN